MHYFLSLNPPNINISLSLTFTELWAFKGGNLNSSSKINYSQDIPGISDEGEFHITLSKENCQMSSYNLIMNQLYMEN